MKKFEAAWHDYVESELKLESGSGLAKAAMAAVRDGRKIRAKRLFREAEEARFSCRDFARLAARCARRFAALA